VPGLASEYVQHLIADLEADLEKYQASIQNRPLHSIFIGGGTERGGNFCIIKSQKGLFSQALKMSH